MVKNLPVIQKTQVRSLSRDDPLEKGMGAHSTVLVIHAEFSNLVFLDMDVREECFWNDVRMKRT